jgi:hypothetical protein
MGIDCLLGATMYIIACEARSGACILGCFRAVHEHESLSLLFFKPLTQF